MLSMLDTLKTNVPGSCDCYCPPNMRRLQCKAIFHLLLIFKANLLIFNFCICVTDVILSVCFRIHKEENRIPQEIAIAECLCQGCIINQREERMYNSVPVFGKLRNVNFWNMLRSIFIKMFKCHFKSTRSRNKKEKKDWFLQ